MLPVAKILLAIMGSTVAWETGVQVKELKERQEVYADAEWYASVKGKPLLVVGTPKNMVAFHHGCGDITIDIDPNIASPCDYEIVDVRRMPFADKYFGAAYCSHVLEHLFTVDDAIQALDELYRVADEIFIVVPSKVSILAHLFPAHHLWVTPVNNGFNIEQRGAGTKRHQSYLVTVQVR